MVALSLVFNLYKLADRPRAWRIKLKKLVASNDELSKQLDNYLRPPAQSEDLRRLKQQQIGWKRRDEADRTKQAKYHAEWKKHLKDNLEEVRAELCDNPGTITNALLYLFDQTRDKKSVSGRWTEYNWKTLISEDGEDVALLSG